MSTIKANAILDASGGNTVTINGATPTAYNTMGKNRIINGAMEIDQRNAGASVSTSSGSGVWTVDRWIAQYNNTSKFTIQQSSTAPEGFTKSVLITSSAATSVGSGDYYLFSQRIEGFNTSDLGFGTANAKTITVSFWVRSSLTGTFGCSLTNDAQVRSYPFTYTISSADTWEKKTVTIAGDTTGTWATNNACSFKLWFGLGVGSSLSGTAGSWAGTQYLGATGATSVVGTSGATFYITGVQLEAGSVATEFERRLYGTELALCQRYYEKSYDTLSAVPTNTTLGNHVGIVDTQSLTAIHANIRFRVEKRTNPTMNFYKYETTAGVWAKNSDNSNTGTLTTPWGIGTTGVGRLDSSTSLSSGGMYHGQWSATAEL